LKYIGKSKSIFICYFFLQKYCHILYSWIFTRSLIIFKIYGIHVINDMCITATMNKLRHRVYKCNDVLFTFFYSDWPLNHNGGGNVKLALKSDSAHHFFRDACTGSGSLWFSRFSGCWLILSVYILMSFDFPFVILHFVSLYFVFVSQFSSTREIPSEQ
jgi:hypothetical protein